MGEKLHHISIPIGVVIGVLAAGLVIGVACLIWFNTLPTPCPVRTDKQFCDRYVELYSKESVCRLDDDTPAPVKAAIKVTGLRLNDTIIPYNYNVEVWPRLYGDFGFNGSVTIYVTCQRQTNVIVLHVDDVTVHNDSIQLRNTITNQPLYHTRVEEDAPRHFYKIYLSESLNVGRNYSISATFNGTLIHTDWAGFYRSSYVENNETKWLASTQFQRTHARRAFPCLDEPALKATFDITVVRQYNHSSISNMPQLRQEVRDALWVADVYERTVVMPTYLVAFVVSEYTYVSSTGPHGLRMRIWTRPTFSKYAEYALNYTGLFIEAFEQWTGINYGLPKLDQIAIPNFRAGAMENWGLVTYRETALLYNPDYSDNIDKRWVASVVAHELAHMWWGNLVTCNWWDDTFLNEGFATYFGDLVGMVGAMPKFQMEEFFQRRMLSIMNYDGNAQSQPVYVANLEHHDDLPKAFNRITYYKGASILRMVKDFLTERTFRTAIQNYLQKYKFSTVVHEDLYRELNKQAELDNTRSWLYTKRNLSSIMDTWIEQQNYPLVTVSDPKDGMVTLSQSHFLFDKDEEIATPTTIGPDFIWDIPVTYASKTELTGRQSVNTSRVKWMHRKKSMKMAVDDSDWTLYNVYAHGYYRVKYGPKTWTALLTQLITNHTVIPVENRAMLLDDAFRLAQAGELADVEPLKAIQYLVWEMEYLPFSTYTSHTSSYLDLLYDTPVHQQLQAYLRNLVLPSYNRLGWTVLDDNSKHLERYIRMITLRQACKLNYKPCVDKARQLYELWMTNPDFNPIHPDLRGFVYCTAVSRGGNREWDFLRTQAEHVLPDVYTAYETSARLGALSCPSMSHVIRKYLDYALSLNATYMVMAISGNRDANDVAWNYINEHWDHFSGANYTRINQSLVLEAVTADWSSESDLQKLQAFIDSHPDPGLNPQYKKVKESVEKNRDWVQNNLEPFQNFLNQVNVGNVTTRSNTSSRRRKRRSFRSHIDVMVADFSIDHLRSEF